MDPLDSLFDILRKERRRYVLYYLDAEDRPVPVEELVAQVARWDAETDTPPVPEETYKRAEIVLTHTDLPKLSDEPYIQYHPKSGRLELTQPPPSFKAIVSIAEVIDNPQIGPPSPTPNNSRKTLRSAVLATTSRSADAIPSSP